MDGGNRTRILLLGETQNPPQTFHRSSNGVWDNKESLQGPVEALDGVRAQSYRIAFN
jgi:hypothetical protein